MPSKQKIKDEIKAYLFFGAVGLLIFFIFIKPIVSDVLDSYKNDNETITNREITEFHEWDKKQQEKQFNNSEWD